MPARTAGKNPDMLEALPYVFAQLDILQMDGVRIERKSAEDRVLDRDGLLINFLEHEVLVAALFRHDRIPGDVLELRLALVTGRIEQANAVTRNHGDFMVVEKQNRSRVRQHRRDIGSDEALSLDGTHDERIAFARHRLDAPLA